MVVVVGVPGPAGSSGFAPMLILGNVMVGLVAIFYNLDIISFQLQECFQ